MAAEELTQEQLLLLDNLMYVKDITKTKYTSVEKFIDDYTVGKIKLTEANLSGGFENHIDQMKEVLLAIKNDPQLMALGIECSTNTKKEDEDNEEDKCNEEDKAKKEDEGEELIRATCFIQYDEAGCSD